MVPVKTNSNWLPSIFNDFFENEWLAKTGVTAPAINVIENDKDYKVEMAAPGMTKDDFKEIGRASCRERVCLYV